MLAVFSESCGILEWENTFGFVSGWKSTLLKNHEIYKGNSKKYKGKMRNQDILVFGPKNNCVECVRWWAAFLRSQRFFWHPYWHTYIWCMSEHHTCQICHICHIWHIWQTWHLAYDMHKFLISSCLIVIMFQVICTQWTFLTKESDMEIQLIKINLYFIFLLVPNLLQLLEEMMKEVLYNLEVEINIIIELRINKTIDKIKYKNICKRCVTSGQV